MYAMAFHIWYWSGPNLLCMYEEKKTKYFTYPTVVLKISDFDAWMRVDDAETVAAAKGGQGRLGQPPGGQ